MRRLLLALLLACACSHPSEKDCKEAALKIEKLRGISQTDEARARMVRQCRSREKKSRVKCILERAQSAEDLEKCGVGD